MKGVALTFGILLLGVLGVAVARTVQFTDRQINPPPAEPLGIDSAAAVERLAAAIRVPTIAREDSTVPDPTPFKVLHALLDSAFPGVHATLTRETVNAASLLYSWKGTDRALPGVLLAAHLDVVPADSARWSRPPFAGVQADGYLWGRGTLDDKVGVMGLLEAIEALIAQGFRPRRTVYLAFGHDEELGGPRGATAIAALLRARGVALDAVIDEGGAVLDGIVPGVAQPVATVGVAEKGSVSLALEVRAAGGHSSVPPAWTAIGTLSRAVDRLERHPFPASLEPSRGLFEAAGPHMTWPYRALFANLWLSKPLLLRVLTRDPSTAAAVRTTLAPTMIDGGVKDNVLPTEARAVVNLRILPGETVAQVVARVRRIAADTAVHVVEIGQADDPSPRSPAGGPVFHALATAIRQVYPTAVVAPYVVVGATDSRHYAGLTRNIYRFLPVRLASAELDRMHGVDERIPVGDYLRAVRVYAQVVRGVAR